MPEARGDVVPEARGDVVPEARGDVGRRRAVMKGAAAALLVFEVIVVLLATLTAVTTTDLDPGVAWTAGGALSLLCIAAAGTLRRGSVGLILGSLAQILAFASGFVVPSMFLLGALFAGLWVMAIVLGRRIEAHQALVDDVV